MGHIVHHAIVVTSWDDKRIERAYEKALALGCQVTPIAPSETNGYRSFLIAPDGSKSGWPNSDEGDARREAFVEYLNSKDAGYLEWVEIKYGSDDSEAVITRSAWPAPTANQT